ncbi:MAG TPA: recombinase zinc beta ribbon domain-containing protein [Caulobacteraceae bacterium]
MHQILTRTTYIRQHKFNYRYYQTKAPKPASEHAIMAVPPIVTEAEFQAVQDALKARSPQWMAPRAVSGPMLLTGTCFCGLCGGAMTLRTGKNGRYRYYTCSTKARMGETLCSGLTVPMDRLDEAVIDHLEKRLQEPTRLAQLMEHLLDRREEWKERRWTHIGEMRQRATEAEAKLKRLYEAIENGLINSAETSLKDRTAELTAIRDQASADAERAAAAVERLGPIITHESLRRFAQAARRKLRNPDGTYRRDHLRAIAQRIEVVDRSQIRIMGSRTELLRTLAANGGEESAVLGVRSFIPKWRARNDSYVRPSDS